MAELNAFCVNGGTCAKGTEWTATFAYNAVIILVSACNICVLMMGASYWVPRYWGTLINCCCACFSMGGWITALHRRYNPVGEACMLNIAPTDHDGLMFDPFGSTY